MYISLDIETTGFNPIEDEIIEFGAIKFSRTGRILKTFSTLVKSQKKIPEIVENLTGIKNEDLSNAPTLEKIKNKIIDFIEDLPIVGHNINFDTTFLKQKALPIKNPEYDTLFLLSAFYRNFNSYSLETVANQLNLTHKNNHRALDDAQAAMELFLLIKKSYASLPPELLNEIKKLSIKSSWNLKKFFLEIEHEKKSPKSLKIEQITHKKSEISPQTLKKILSLKNSAIIETQTSFLEIIPPLMKDPDTIISVPKKILENLPEIKGKKDIFSNYLSSERLNNLLKKTKFLEHEIAAIVKILLWQFQTESKLLSDLKLFAKEKIIIRQINEIAKKEKSDSLETKNYVCTHDFLIDEEIKNKKLYIFDLHEFSQSLKRHFSIFLTLENMLIPLLHLENQFPENLAVKNIINKAAITYGIISIMYGNHRKQNTKMRLTSAFIHTKEWLQINDAIINLIEISAQLVQILNEKSLPELKKWKQDLKKLNTIFREFDPEKNIITLEENEYTEIVIKSEPISLEKNFSSILEKGQQVFIFDKAISLNDEAIFSKTFFDVDKKIAFKEIDNELHNIKIQKQNEKNIHGLISKKNDTAIIINSKIQLFKTTVFLEKQMKNHTIISQSQGSLSKMEEQYAMSAPPHILLFYPSGWKSFAFANEIQNLIIHKIPFLHPDSNDYLSREKKFTPAFLNLQMPYATLKLKQIINRISKKDAPDKFVFLVDPRFDTQKYGKKILNTLIKSYKR